ncbi:MAG: FMN-binding protein [Bacteroidaceae bacterium]|nr:FMN-binding protein [Bacteroidaceae bacterium]
MKSKKTLFGATIALLLVVGLTLFLSLKPNDGVMTRKGDVYIVNTTKLTPELRGYGGAVPLEVKITNDKITDLRALPNHETPEFFNSAKSKLFAYYKGKTVKAALASRPDAVSGATYSSRAIMGNVEEALKYYQAHK